MGVVAALLGLSWVIAILIGSTLTDPKYHAFISSTSIFWCAAALALVNMIALFTLYRETLLIKTENRASLFKGIHRIIHILEIKPLRTFYLMFFFWFLGYIISLQWIFPISIEKFHVLEKQILWLFVIWGAVWVFSSGVLNRWLIERFSLWPLTLWSLFSVSLFLFFSGVSDFFLYFAITYVLSSLFAALTWGNTISIISLAVRQEQQGRAMGITVSMFALTQFLGPLLGGIIAGFSLVPLFYSCSLLVFVSFLLPLIYVIRPKKTRLRKFYMHPVKR